MPHAPLEMAPLLVRDPATATPEPAVVATVPVLLTVDPRPSAVIPFTDEVTWPLLAIVETPMPNTPKPSEVPGAARAIMVPALLSVSELWALMPYEEPVIDPVNAFVTARGLSV